MLKGKTVTVQPGGIQDNFLQTVSGEAQACRDKWGLDDWIKFVQE